VIPAVKRSILATALSVAATVAGAAQIPEYPFVSAPGSADSKVAPDIAHCALTVSVRDADASKAAAAVQSRFEAVLAMFAAGHVADADIEADKVDKNVLTENEHETVGIKGYELARHVSFTSRQLESLPPLEQSLLHAPNVTDISCRFDRTDRAALEADLMTSALKSAREEAERLAAPLGRHVVAAMAVSKVSFADIPGEFGFGDRQMISASASRRMFKRSALADELLVPATVELSESVNVLFKVE
jgi:uncharacterized protein YggE